MTQLCMVKNKKHEGVGENEKNHGFTNDVGGRAVGSSMCTGATASSRNRGGCSGTHGISHYYG